MIFINENEIKQIVLHQAAEQREREILDYQINIDNYRLAIKKIEQESIDDLLEFKTQLESLLQSSVLEQAKAKLIYDVIVEQLDVLPS
jgi:hypothetical protein